MALSVVAVIINGCALSKCCDLDKISTANLAFFSGSVCSSLSEESLGRLRPMLEALFWAALWVFGRRVEDLVDCRPSLLREKVVGAIEPESDLVLRSFFELLWN